MKSMRICAKRNDRVKSSRRHRGVVFMMAVVVGRNKIFHSENINVSCVDVDGKSQHSIYTWNFIFMCDRIHFVTFWVSFSLSVCLCLASLAQCNRVKCCPLKIPCTLDTYGA